MEEERYVPLFGRPAADAPEDVPPQDETTGYVPQFGPETPAEGDAGFAPEPGRAFGSDAPTLAGTAPYAQQFTPPESDEPYEHLFTGDGAGAEPEADGFTDDGEEYYEEDGYVFTKKELEKESAETDWRDVEDPEEREELLARRDFFRTLSGVSDVVLVFLLTGAILILIWLIVALVRYVQSDLPERFTLLQHLGSLPRGGDFHV